MLDKIIRAYRPQEIIISTIILLVATLAVFHFLIFRVIWPPISALITPVYTEGHVGEVPYLNPLLATFNSTNRDITRLLYEGLVRYNPEKKQFEPALATFAVNDEVTEYLFTLKKDLVWHDGESITADDVIFTYGVLKSTAFDNDLVKSAFFDVEVEKIDEETVVFTLARPNAFFLANLMMPILPEHVFSEVPIEVLAGDIPTDLLIGTGPYKLDTVERTTTDSGVVTDVTFSAFADYYLGKPKIADIVLHYYPSNDALLADLDQLDAIPFIPDDLTEMQFLDFTVKNYQLPQYQALFLNQNSPLLRTERLRKTLKNAFDRNYLVETLPNKQTIAGPYFFLEQLGVIPDRVLSIIQRDLDELGFTLDGAIRRNDEGQALSFVLLVRDFASETLMKEQDVIIGHMLDTATELGIRFDVIHADSETFAAKLFNKDYDIVLYGQDFAYNLDAYSFWHSSQVGPGTLNLSNFQSVSADAILDDLRRTRDADERKLLLEKLNNTLKFDAPAIFLYTQKYRFAFDNELKNRTILPDYSTIADRFFNVHLWEKP